jgi:hypothetical protein
MPTSYAPNPRAPTVPTTQAGAHHYAGANRSLTSSAAGAQRVRRKTVEAVDLAKLHGNDDVNRALGTCAPAGRFADGTSPRSWRTSSAPES